MARSAHGIDAVSSWLDERGETFNAVDEAEARLLYHDRIVCAGGDHRHSLSLDPRELVRVAEPRVADVCEREEPRHDEDFGELRGV